MSRNPKPTMIGRTAGNTVSVYLRSGISADLGSLLKPQKRNRSLALVCDAIVARHHGESLRRNLKRAGWKVYTQSLKGGEGTKISRTVDRLHTDWLRAGHDRATPIVAVGGGTIGDTVGFAAATFMRGLPLWHVPTTIVAQVDSALGGKVGINHPKGKNLIGSFYQPTGVIIDPRFLTTLPVREFCSGLAEVLKYGVIADAHLFAECEKHLPNWVDGTRALDQPVIAKCASIKLRVVGVDERDTGARHILNFGHTLGHALEAWGQFKSLRHGEAVTLGMVAASWMALQRGDLGQRGFLRIERACRIIAPHPRHTRFEPADVTPYLAIDKKRAGGVNAWVLPVGIGKVTIVRNATDKEIVAALRFVRQWLAESRKG
jgi:3-dehydroquinate synthase